MLNLTPHAITIVTPNGDVTIEPSGTVARVDTIETVVGVCTITDVAIVERVLGIVTGLPEESVVCLVSAMVLSAVPKRANTFAPDTGNTAIRNEKGHIVKVTRLVKA